MSIDLRNVTMFSKLASTDLEQLLVSFKPRQLSAGEVLFNQGDPGAELILVEDGKVAIYAPVPGKPKEGQPIRLFQTGELLGEMAIIDRKPRSVSARAEETTKVLTLDGEVFRKLVSDNPEMAFSVMAGLSDRIRYTTDFLSEVRQWVRKIAEGSYQGSVTLDETIRYKDQTLATLAAEFAQMAVRVQEREESLKQEMAQLRIEIDEVKRKQEAEQIMGSDYYKSLKEKVKNLRQKPE